VVDGIGIVNGTGRIANGFGFGFGFGFLTIS
jgi:hypothetical protein